MYTDFDISDLDITIMWLVNLICFILSVVSFLDEYYSTRYQTQGPRFQNTAAVLVKYQRYQIYRKLKKVLKSCNAVLILVPASDPM